MFCAHIPSTEGFNLLDHATIHYLSDLSKHHIRKQTEYIKKIRNFRNFLDRSIYTVLWYTIIRYPNKVKRF